MGYAFAADGQAPEATRYCSEMTETQKAEIRHDTVMAVRVIDPDEEAQRLKRIMAEADDRTRELLERKADLIRLRLATAATQACACATLAVVLPRVPIPGPKTGVPRPCLLLA